MAFNMCASMNVLWKNFIALNASLAKENEEKRDQLILTENMLQERTETTKILRTRMEEQKVEHEKELLKKNREVFRLTSKLGKVKQLMNNLFKDDDSDNETSSIIEEEAKPNIKSTSSKQSSGQNFSCNQRKIANLFSSACHNNIKLEATHAVGMNSDSDSEDEDCLVPSQSSLNESPSEKVCNDCGRKFTSIILLKRHELLHTELRQQKIKSEEQLMQGNRIRNGKKKKKFACRECPKTLASRSSLNRHLFVHTDQKPFVCSMCSLAFRRSDHLKSHVKKIHKNDVLQNADNSTGERTRPKTKRSLSSHKKRQHKKGSTKKRGIKNISCDECDVKFSYFHTLTKHKRNLHNQD